MRFVLTEEPVNCWRWNLVADDGLVMATSAVDYPAKAQAVVAIRRFREGLANAPDPDDAGPD